MKAHNDERTDWYYWLRDDERKNKDVINYLRKENRYAKKWFDDNGVSGKKIYQTYIKKLPKLDKTYPTDIDGYKYFSTISISSEYRKYFRVYKKQKN